MRTGRGQEGEVGGCAWILDLDRRVPAHLQALELRDLRPEGLRRDARRRRIRLASPERREHGIDSFAQGIITLRDPCGGVGVGEIRSALGRRLARGHRDDVARSDRAHLNVVLDLGDRLAAAELLLRPGGHGIVVDELGGGLDGDGRILRLGHQTERREGRVVGRDRGHQDVCSGFIRLSGRDHVHHRRRYSERSDRADKKCSFAHRPQEPAEIALGDRRLLPRAICRAGYGPGLSFRNLMLTSWQAVQVRRPLS